MGTLRFDFSVAFVSFIDAMMGLLAFCYLNIQQYRHKRLGTQEEVIMSYVLAMYGFLKGLGLCIPASQVMVNRRMALTAQRAAYSWLIFSVAQIGFTFILLYYFIWPVNSKLGSSDLFLFILRIVHVKFLIICSIFILLFISELEQFIPKRIPQPRVSERPRKPQVPGKKKSRTSAKHRVADAPERVEDPEPDEEQHESD